MTRAQSTELPATAADPRAADASVERIYYDGDCGVCHWAVGFVARRDPEGRTFRFAPLDGETFLREVPEEVREDLPDSMVVQTEGGDVLLRSRGLVYILRRLGGVWGFLGRLLWLVPRALRRAPPSVLITSCMILRW